ncbi:MAG: cobalamin biosynthesis protein [Nitrospinae bacterium]|nr:cobalamin biosynthesis protein [Nitrospinota bacterium]
MPPSTKKGLLIFALTRKGSENAVLLHSRIGGDLFLPEKFREGCAASGANFFSSPLAGMMEKFFIEYREIIGFCAVGAMARLIAPLLRDKKTDPAVVALDECARFAVSVVSGHIGGANILAGKVASILGAIPVITTASDVSGTLAVDLLGRDMGWRVEKLENITKVSADVVNGEKVGLVQTCGESDWPESRPLPENISLFSSIEEAQAEKPESLLIITDQLIEDGQLDALAEKTLVYRPKSLVIGVGCNKGAPLEELEEALTAVLEENRLSFYSIRNLATIDQKREEPSFLAFSKKYGIPISYYSASELNSVKVPNPSEAALEHVGAQGVAEPAALLDSGGDFLLREKIKKGNYTIAIARVKG